MIKNEKQIRLLWNKLIDDMDGDDIVLEIKISGTSIEDYNNLFKDLSKSLPFSYNYSLGTINKELPKSIENYYFDQDEIREIKVDLEKITLFNSLFEENEIEFYTNSVVGLDYRNSNTFFMFIKWLGNSIRKKIDVFIESHPYPSISYNFKNSLFVTYTYIDND